MAGKVKYIPMGTTGGWEKIGTKPVIGPEYGTTFDVSVLFDEGIYKMWLSWRDVRLIAYTESMDGVKWEHPQAVLTAVPGSDWEGMEVNRPTVVKKDGKYHMWYTGQMFALENQLSRSCIGYACSEDGIHWKRYGKPVIQPEEKWEKYCTMCPHVNWDEEEQIFKMWYSGGRMQEADFIGYATSKDGITWEKYKDNPIFSPKPENFWEMARTEACFVQKEKDWYYMFYLAHNGDGNSSINLARSKDGITDWERHPENPILAGTDGLWDWKGTCKASVLKTDDGYQLWYNAANNYGEQIGYAYHKGHDLFPEHIGEKHTERGTPEEFPQAVNFYYHRYNMLKE